MSNGAFIIPLCLPAQAAAETEATILAWKVAAGDTFTKGQILAEVESAKSSFEFEAPCSGVIKTLLAARGATVPIDKPVVEIETSDTSMHQAIPSAGIKNDAETPRLEIQVAERVQFAVGDGVYLVSVGGYAPERVVTNAELLKEFPDITEEYIFGVTGIRERRWAAAGQKPSDLALMAALDAITKAKIDASEIEAIVLATETPDVAMPATACILQDKLGLRGIPAFDIHAACSGWLYALTVAQGLLLSNFARTALVVGVDMQSRLLDKKDKGTYFLFGDGTSAAILSCEQTGHRLKKEILIADPKGLGMARRHTPGYTIAAAGDAVDPWVRVDGHALFRFATESFATIIRDVIAKSGWKPEEVRWVIPHQANGRILKAAAQKSSVPFERFYLNIDRMGNTSSASIPLALIEVEKGLQSGDKIVLCSVGAGITAAAITIEW